MSARIIIRGHGIQADMEAPIPVPFDIKRDLLAGSHLDPKIMGFLVRAYINKMAPSQEGVSLFSWFNMSSSQLLTTVLAYVQVNETKNRQVGELKKFKPITDEDVKIRLQQIVEDDGYISPRAWDERFPASKLRR